MGRAKDISDSKKVEIETYLKTGIYSQREIGRKCNVSQSTVAKISKKMKEGCTSASGRPCQLRQHRATTQRADRKMIEICVKNRKKPLNALGKEVREMGVNVSDRTIRRRLKESGFSCRRPAKKPLLTKTMQLKRLAWAKKHRGMTENDWEQVIHIKTC